MLVLLAIAVPLSARTLGARPSLKQPALPCVGLAASSTRELIVVGTAHTPCRSAAEVSSVILTAKPDVVIVELDQERLETLQRLAPSELKYGADLAAAASAADRLGVPIVLGDAKARETMASLRAPGAIADPARLQRAARLWLGDFLMGRGGRDELRLKPVSVARSLVDDPAKMLPLLAGLWWAVLLSAATMMPRAAPAIDGVSSGPWFVPTASLGLALGALAIGLRVVDVLLLSRDEVRKHARALRSGTRA